MICHGHILAEVDILEQCVQEMARMLISSNSVILCEKGFVWIPRKELEIYSKNIS